MYRVYSETGKVVSRHRTVETAARVIVKAGAQRNWGIWSESHGVLGKREQAKARAILYPAPAEAGGEKP